MTFEAGTALRVDCLWRLLEDDRVRFTSEDEGQWFGLPAPVNAAAEVNRRIAGATVLAVDIRRDTLDLALWLSSGHAFEVIPNSSGYEAWQFDGDGLSIVAVGGGDLWVSGGAR